MKKFISLALVAAMIATMGVTAFAATQAEMETDRETAITRGTDDNTEGMKKLKVNNVELYKGDYTETGYQPSENIVFFPLMYVDGNKEYYIVDTPPSPARHQGAGWTMQLNLNAMGGGRYSKNTKEEFMTAVISAIYAGDIPSRKNDVAADRATMTAYLALSEKDQADMAIPAAKAGATLLGAVMGDVPGLDTSQTMINYLEFLPEIPGPTLGKGGRQIDFRKDWVLASNIEDFSDVDIDYKITSGKDYVRIVFVDIAGDNDQWNVKFVHHDNNTGGDVRVKGNLQLTAKNKKLGDDFNFNYKIEAPTLKFEGEEFLDANGNPMPGIEFGGGDAFINLLDFNQRQPSDLDKSPKIANFTSDVENIELEDDDSFHFEVKASHQGKVNLNYNNFADAKIMPKAPRGAELLFMNCYGRPEFDFTGTATFTFPDTDKEYFLYEINPDSTVSEVKGYTLNEDEDGFELKTRVLGRYVLSDMEFAPAALSVYDPNAKPGDETAGDTTGEQETTVEDGTKENPSTGVTTALVF